jgi:hypothetical protein
MNMHNSFIVIVYTEDTISEKAITLNEFFVRGGKSAELDGDSFCHHVAGGPKGEDLVYNADFRKDDCVRPDSCCLVAEGVVGPVIIRGGDIVSESIAFAMDLHRCNLLVRTQQLVLGQQRRKVFGVRGSGGATEGNGEEAGGDSFT